MTMLTKTVMIDEYGEVYNGCNESDDGDDDDYDSGDSAG